jgi:hypothetical protein
MSCSSKIYWDVAKSENCQWQFGNEPSGSNLLLAVKFGGRRMRQGTRLTYQKSFVLVREDTKL